MIRTFTITAPLTQLTGDEAVATLQAAGDKLRRLYTHFVRCQARVQDGQLTLALTVSSRDQWSCSATARKIGTNLLLRVKIPADTATMQLTATAPPATTLTKEQGRGYRKPKGHLNNGAEAS